MAANRLERIGTIYTRTRDLIKGGALNPENIPIWYQIYEVFPPKLEPRYNRAAPNTEIREIFYKEDEIRAKFQKENAKFLRFNLFRNNVKSATQRFIAIYNELEKSGTPETELYDKAMETFKAENINFREVRRRAGTQREAEVSTLEDSPKSNKINLDYSKLLNPKS